MTREEAIKNITTYLYAEFENIPKQVIEAMQMAIESLGNDTNVGNKWIPCSERLPEEGQEVLIATKTSEKVYFGMYTKRYGYNMREGFIIGEGFMWLNTALAWQPLPEPYKEGDT